MATFSDIRKHAEVEPVTFTDHSTPEGTFGAVTRVLGLVTTYLFRGEEGDLEAPVLGRIESSPNANDLSTTAIAGSGVKGGTRLAPGDSVAVFAEMVRRQSL